ncbi:hypothetical protein ABKV19_000150 [Rosa sericea]
MFGFEPGLVEFGELEFWVLWLLRIHGSGWVPALGAIVGLVTEAMVGQEGEEVAEQGVAGVVGEEIEVESGGEPPDVDPTVGAIHWVGVELID